MYTHGGCPLVEIQDSIEINSVLAETLEMFESLMLSDLLDNVYGAEDG